MPFLGGSVFMFGTGMSSHRDVLRRRRWVVVSMKSNRKRNCIFLSALDLQALTLLGVPTHVPSTLTRARLRKFNIFSL